MIPAMIASVRHFLGRLVSAFRSRKDLVLEDLALHQQLLALHALFRKGFATRTLSEFGREPLLLVLKFQLNPGILGRRFYLH